MPRVCFVRIFEISTEVLEYGNCIIMRIINFANNISVIRKLNHIICLKWIVHVKILGVSNNAKR